MAKLTFYVQALAKFGYSDYMYQDLQLGNVTANKPKKPLSNAKVVKVILTIPDSVFKDAIPVVNIDVPAEHVGVPFITGITEEVDQDEYAGVS